MNQNGATTLPLTRDPERTRRRILTAALAEFSTKGFAGARVDAIARRAQGNKRMIYHYFGNKETLFTAVLRHKMSERRSWAVAMINDPAKRLPFWFSSACANADWIRLLEWEALQGTSRRVIDEKRRQADSADWMQRMRRRQREGQLTRAFNLRHLALAMQSLTVFPVAFPQIVRLTTGRTVDDPKFQAGYRRFLKEFADAFKSGRRPDHRSKQ